MSEMKDFQEPVQHFQIVAMFLWNCIFCTLSSNIPTYVAPLPLIPEKKLYQLRLWNSTAPLLEKLHCKTVWGRRYFHPIKDIQVVGVGKKPQGKERRCKTTFSAPTSLSLGQQEAICDCMFWSHYKTSVQQGPIVMLWVLNVQHCPSAETPGCRFRRMLSKTDEDWTNPSAALCQTLDRPSHLKLTAMLWSTWCYPNFTEERTVQC